MPLSLDDIVFLQSDEAQSLLQDYAMADVSDSNMLNLVMVLRQSLSMEQTSAILTTVRLRQQAVDKFPYDAHNLLFTDDSLQQASDVRIRQYRAGLVAGRSVADICCSIGSDALAFAGRGCDVVGFDIDPVRIAIARHNAEVMGLPVMFEVRDVTQMRYAHYDVMFYDPARRKSDGNRIFDVEQYIPPLSLAHQFHAEQIAVKLSPAVDLNQLREYGGQVEFVSVEGSLKEAVLWMNRADMHPMATLIQGDHVHQLHYDHDAQVDVRPPRAWLFEPDASVLRAGLVQHLAEQLGATMLDDTIAYVSMDARVETVWGRYWRVEDWMPFNLKKLKRYLVERDVGQVTVKKRGFPMSPEEVIRKLKLKKGRESRVLVMTRHQGEPVVVICHAL
jgi:hypothetical protein